MGAEVIPQVVKHREGAFQFHVRNKRIRQIEVTNLLDVGCFKGDTLKAYAGLMNPRFCFGFEPCFDSFWDAIWNVPNGCKLFNVAVGDKDCKVVFKEYSHPKRHSILERFGEESVEEHPVDMIRLDTWARREGVETLDFVKIDTQGFDFNVIQGMGELIRTVKILIMEMMFDSLEYAGVPAFFDSFSYLHNLGLHFYSFRDLHYDPSGRTRFADVIFLNRESMEIVCS